MTATWFAAACKEFRLAFVEITSVDRVGSRPYRDVAAASEVG